MKLLKECALQTLQDRRTVAKLVLFFKMKKGKSPEYLQNLIPEEVQTRTAYNLRNSQDVMLPKVTKNYFLKSFIPSTIRAWNKLSMDIRNIADVDTFKDTLSKLYGKIETYKPYLQGLTEGHIQLSRFRMGLSGLNAHRHRYHFIDFRDCHMCNSHVEDEIHFIFECPAYAAARQQMLTRLRHVLPRYNHSFNHLNTKRNKQILAKLFIHGTGCKEIDTEVFGIVSTFIVTSKRFAP